MKIKRRLYDRLQESKWSKEWPETTGDSSPGNAGTEPASETAEEMLATLATRLNRGEETITESGKTEPAELRNASDDNISGFTGMTGSM